MDHFLVLHMITLKGYHVQSVLSDVLNKLKYILMALIGMKHQNITSGLLQFVHDNVLIGYTIHSHCP